MGKYSPELAQKVCEGLMQGKSLVRVCKDLKIVYGDIYKWIAENEEFKNNYTHAREMQADFLADGIIEIADDVLADPNDRRVRIDARKWYAGKLKPKKYGDRTVLSGDEENPINQQVSIKVHIGS